VAQLAAWPELIPKFIFVLLFVGVGEETGWRGFALPELQKRLSPVVASVVLGAIWAAWHIPLFGVEFAPAVVPWFVLSVLAGAVIRLWWIYAGIWALAAAGFAVFSEDMKPRLKLEATAA